MIKLYDKHKKKEYPSYSSTKQKNEDKHAGNSNLLYKFIFARKKYITHEKRFEKAFF